jgi:hypothetical protein
MTRRRRVLLCTVSAALVISGAVFLLFLVKGVFGASAGPVLEIKDADSGKVYGRWSLDESGEFAVEFVHSVNQSPVREIFKVEGAAIRTMAVRFFTFGAGMQVDLDGGKVMTRDGDAMVISGFDSSSGELNYIVGTVSDHLLYISGETVSLRDLCGRNAHIKIRPK